MPPTPVPCLRAFLVGAPWRFLRSIQDFRSAGAPAAVVEGTASWVEDAADAGVLRFEERGALTVEGGPSVETRAAYAWRLGPTPSAARVRFPDGRDFHDVDLATGACGRVRHVCGADTYEGSFRAAAGDATGATSATDAPTGTGGNGNPGGAASLLVTWRVRGPTKDYESVTAFTRDG